MQRLLINALAVLALLSALFCVFVIVTAYKTKAAARTLLAEFSNLGTAARLPKFEPIQRKHAGQLHTVGCDQQYCQYEMSISNSNISVLGLVPYTEMKLLFSTYGPDVEWAMLEYRSALKAANSPVLHVQQGLCAHGCGLRFDVNPHGTTTQRWNGLVEFNTRATSEQREASLALNLDCFIRIGGCKDIVDLLPTVWSRSGPDKVSSRLVGLSQRLEESHGYPTQDDF